MQDKKFRITAPTITNTMNKAGSFQFTMPFNNPKYNDYTKLKTIVTIKEDGNLIWKGRVLDTSRDFYNNKKFLCEGELAFLNDALVPPYDYSESGITVGNFLQMCFQHYLENCPVERKISLGIITAVNSSTTIYPKSESYVNVLETILDQLVSELGGYLSIRHQNEESYLDYLNTEINLTEQKIQFGINLLDLTEHVDASDVYTYLIPLGKRDEDGNRVTIESVNDGAIYIKSTTGENLFGKIERCIIWDNIDNPSTLKSLAEDELETAIKESTTIELSAVDLKNLGVEVDHIQIGEYVTVISNPHGIHDNFLCTEITIDLQNAANNTYTIGGTVPSITESHSNTVITVGNTMVTTDWLQAAIDNATAMMTGSKGGYKVTEYDEHGRWLRDLYMNAPNKEDATLVMQVNMNGIGFSREGFDGPYKNAWTIDGTLLGEFIKAGSITAQQLSVDYKESVTKEIATQFNVAKNLIEGKVSKDEFGSYVQQYYDRVIIGFNNASKYVQFDTEGISFYNNGVSSSKKRATIDENGAHFYRDGYYVGKIGTTSYYADESDKGLVFDLEYQGKYMGWAYKLNSSADQGTLVLGYASGNDTIWNEKGLHALADMNMHYHKLSHVDLSDVSVNDLSGWSGTIPIVTQISSSGGTINWSNSSIVVEDGIIVSGPR